MTVATVSHHSDDAPPVSDAENERAAHSVVMLLMARLRPRVLAVPENAAPAAICVRSSSYGAGRRIPGFDDSPSHDTRRTVGGLALRHGPWQVPGTSHRCARHQPIEGRTVRACGGAAFRQVVENQRPALRDGIFVDPGSFEDMAVNENGDALAVVGDDVAA